MDFAGHSVGEIENIKDQREVIAIHWTKMARYEQVIIAGIVKVGKGHEGWVPVGRFERPLYLQQADTRRTLRQ